MLTLFQQELPKTLVVRVTPKASSNRLKVEYKDDGTIHLVRAYVTAIPENGKGNKEVIALLAKALGVSKDSLTIIQGHKIRDKVIRIDV